VTHVFRRIGENLLVTAPELIHLSRSPTRSRTSCGRSRLTAAFLDTRGGKTGFTHRPFGADFADGTKIVGRIPRLNGTGVKGQHQPDLIIDEGQDYPEAGWTEVHETVLKDHVDADGNPDFTYHFYGVHTGRARHRLRGAVEGRASFKIVQVTAIQRPGWGKPPGEVGREGGVRRHDNSDYRRNILGEPGAAASPFFVTARLFACVDQDRDSLQPARVRRRSSVENRARGVRGERPADRREVLDLPSGLKCVYGGMDVGLNRSPSVITLWSKEKVNKTRAQAAQAVRRIQLERMRVADAARGAVRDRRALRRARSRASASTSPASACRCSRRSRATSSRRRGLLEVTRGYFFNAKVPVSVEKEDVSEDDAGPVPAHARRRGAGGVRPAHRHQALRDDMPMIEASTRYLREMVDRTYILLPFDGGHHRHAGRDAAARGADRRAQAEARRVPHLDSMRAMAMVYHATEIETELGRVHQR
jgi:hypothetical protein